MNKIVGKEYFSEKIVKIVVEAPLIAKSRKPGNFVILRVGEKGERIPLTIAGANVEKGTIDLVVQKMGVSSTKVCDLEVGDFVWSGGDCHVYLNHFEQVETQLKRTPKKLPKILIHRKPENIFDYKYKDFELYEYEHDDPIKAPVAI